MGTTHYGAMEHDENPERYEAGDEPNTDSNDDLNADGVEDFEHGNPEEEMNQPIEHNPNDTTTMGEGIDDDPMVAKIFQSRQMQDLVSKVDMIFNALQEEGSGSPHGGGEAPPTDDGMSTPMNGGGQSSPMGGEPSTDEGEEPSEEDGPPHDEEMRMHGDKPVQFNASSFGGPGNTTIPTIGGPKGNKNYMFNRNSSTHGTNGMTPQQNQQMTRMQRRLEDVTMRLARSDAATLIAQLKSEGILFGDTPTEAAQGEAEEAEFLALLSDEDRDYHINNVIRKRYKREQTPATRQMGPARFARDPYADGTLMGNGTPGEDFEPKTPQEASDFADLITIRKMPRIEAIKFMRNRGRR